MKIYKLSIDDTFGNNDYHYEEFYLNLPKVIDAFWKKIDEFIGDIEVDKNNVDFSENCYQYHEEYSWFIAKYEEVNVIE